jgi:hypothetical protein
MDRDGEPWIDPTSQSEHRNALLERRQRLVQMLPAEDELTARTDRYRLGRSIATEKLLDAIDDIDDELNAMDE